MSLTDEQRKVYESQLTTARSEMGKLNSQIKDEYRRQLEEDIRRQTEGDLDRSIEEELKKIKDRLAELQDAKNDKRRIYDAACMRLGISNDLDDD